MKKIAILGLVAAVLCGCVKKDEDTIRMITEATFPPYEFLRGDEVVGIDVEICRAVAEKLGKKFVVESVNFDSVIPGIVFVYKTTDPYLTGDAAKGKKVGVQSGTTSETYVIETLGQQPERFDSPAAAVAALKAGRVDVVLADVDPAKNCVKGEDSLAISDFVTTEEYAVAIRKGQPELLKVINETIEELKANGKLAAWTVQFTEEADKLKD